MSAEAIVLSIVGAVISGAIGLFGWYFKRNLDRLDDNDKKHQTEIDTLVKALSDYKLEALREFTIRDDFIRQMSRQDQKLDKIYDEITKLGRGGTHEN